MAVEITLVNGEKLVAHQVDTQIIQELFDECPHAVTWRIKNGPLVFVRHIVKVEDI